MSSESMRINRFLARAGLGSRRKVEQLIQAGRISINGKTISDFGTRVQEQDQVCLDGGPVQALLEHFYLALNKPEGYIVSHKVHPGQKSVYELIPQKYKKCNYIGRLDQNSCGLLLFSNDGDFIQRFAHPSLKTERHYAVQVEAPGLDENHIRSAFLEGIRDEGEMLRAVAIDLQPLADRLDNRVCYELKVSLQTGRKRQLRRMCAACNLKVRRLERVAIGQLQLTDLKLAQGQIKELDEQALLQLGWKPAAQ